VQTGEKIFVCHIGIRKWQGPFYGHTWAEKPSSLTRLVTVSRGVLHYVNTEGVAEDRSPLRAGDRGRLPLQ